MCSIIEAWGDMPTLETPTTSSSQASANTIRGGQLAMDAQRNSNRNNNGAIALDQVGQYYTQSDDRRQYARPVAELSEYRDWHSEFNRKPAPEANGIARGFNGKYDRTPRTSHANNGVFTGLETDVNPAYFARSDPTVESGLRTPAYLDTYPDPKYAIPNVGPLGMSSSGNNKGPAAANTTVETFMSLGQDYFKDMGASPENKFTPEQITDEKLLAVTPTVPASDIKFADNQLSPAGPSANDTVATTGRDKQIQAILTRLAELERKMSTVDTSKSHDIILFIVIGIFVLFVLDNIFKLNRFL